MADANERTLENVSGPLAFFSDVQGNLAALEAVTAACISVGARTMFAAGDLLLHGDEPLEVWKRLTDLGVQCVRGPSDVALAAVAPSRLRPRTESERARVAKFESTRTQVGELILARLLRLPDILRLELPDAREIIVVHGSPTDPLQPMTHDLRDEELSAMLGTDGADIVFCGGALTPFSRRVGDVTVVNTGSVGADRANRIAHYVLFRPGRELQEGAGEVETRFVAY